MGSESRKGRAAGVVVLVHREERRLVADIGYVLVVEEV